MRFKLESFTKKLYFAISLGFIFTGIEIPFNNSGILVPYSQTASV